MNIESCIDVTIKNTILEDLRSSSGNVTGIEVMFKSENVKGEVKVNNMRTI